MSAIDSSYAPKHTSGGGLSTMVESLDLLTRKDCGILRKAIRKRWGVTDEFKDKAMVALEAALEAAREQADYRAVGFIVNTLATIEGQNQKDEHREADAAEGRHSGQVTVIVERLAPPNQGSPPALPPRPAADDRPRATIQRGYVGETIRQDDDGGVPAD